ncbi:MAG: hypothetical protein AAF645_13095, partial [Myxococcota bacterium]
MQHRDGALFAGQRRDFRIQEEALPIAQKIELNAIGLLVARRTHRFVERLAVQYFLRGAAVRSLRHERIEGRVRLLNAPQRIGHEHRLDHGVEHRSQAILFVPQGRDLLPKLVRHAAERAPDLSQLGRSLGRMSDQLGEQIATLRHEQDRLRPVLNTMVEAVFVADPLG